MDDVDRSVGGGVGVDRNRDVDNLALVGGRHPTLVHTGDRLLEIRDGVPWVTPPAWVDPLRRPIRNLVFGAEQTAQQLGQTLRWS